MSPDRREAGKIARATASMLAHRIHSSPISYTRTRRSHDDGYKKLIDCGAEIGAKTWTHGLIQPLDKGNFDNRRLLGILDDIGYEGAIGLMCYGVPDDPREHLARSMAKWQDWQTGRP